MEIRYTVILFALFMIIGTHCQYKPHNLNPGTCKLEKNQIGRKIIEMSDRSRVQGTRVDFSSHGIGMDYSSSGCDLKAVFEFRGLKYGEVMSGTKALRFFTSRTPGRAIEPKHFATNFRPVCPQKRMSYAAYGLPQSVWYRWVNKTGVLTENQSEECLWINLYLPDKQWNETKLPVMIFVHGESYEVGTGNAYDGSILASYGRVIVITVNYRLGVLGFLSTGDSEAEGNYALWDLVAILYWVKDNIERFGGDSSRVTLFGHGHGAALVNMLLFTKALSDKDELFNNVILQSGSAYSTWAQSIDPVRCTNMLARNVNCSHAINDTKALVKCLREKSVDELIKNVPLTPKYYTCFAPSFGLGIFPQGKSLDELIASGKTAFANKKIMFGLTRKEAYSYLKQEEIENGISESRKQQIIRTYVQNVFKFHRQKIFDILLHEYTTWDRPVDNFSRRDDVMDLLSDGQYKAPMIKMAQAHSKTADTYMYSFAYSTQSEDFAQWSGGVHGDELPYIFGAPLVGGSSPFPTSYNSLEVELSKYMMRMWTNFAKTGDPNLPEWGSAEKDHSNSGFFSGVKWPKYNMSTQSYLHIGRKGSRMKDYYRGKEAALWLQLIPKLNHPGGTNVTDYVHQLENADNMTTFDDPSRLISKFHSIFPYPPPPPFTPPYKTTQSDSSCATEDKLEDTTHDSVNHTVPPKGGKMNEESTGHKPPNEVAGTPTREERSKSDSGLPVSAVLIIGCILLFSNLLLVAGICYQRRKVTKLQEGQSAAQMNSLTHVDRHDHLNNTMHRQIGGGAPETVNLMSSKDTLQHAKTASLNHKPPIISDNAPMYSSISKPVVSPQGPGGYTYSALSQKSSPMHSKPPVVPQSQTTSFTNVVQSTQGGPPGPPSESGGSQASSRTNDSLPRPQPPVSGDRSPKVDTGRTKQINRSNHQVTSNNAITIV